MSDVRSFFAKGRVADAENRAPRIRFVLTQVSVFISITTVLRPVNGARGSRQQKQHRRVCGYRNRGQPVAFGLRIEGSGPGGSGRDQRPLRSTVGWSPRTGVGSAWVPFR